MMYTRSQNYPNIVVAEHRILTFEVVVFVLLLLLLSFDVFVPQMQIPYCFFFDKLFVQIYLNVS